MGPNWSGCIQGVVTKVDWLAGTTLHTGPVTSRVEVYTYLFAFFDCYVNYLSRAAYTGARNAGEQRKDGVDK